jgi:hypothetical protein
MTLGHSRPMMQPVTLSEPSWPQHGIPFPSHRGSIKTVGSSSSLNAFWMVRQLAPGTDPSSGAARARVRFLVTSGFLESYRAALAVRIGSWFPAGPESDSWLTQGLRPGLFCAAPAGLDWGGVCRVCSAGRPRGGRHVIFTGPLKMLIARGRTADPSLCSG